MYPHFHFKLGMVTMALRENYMISPLHHHGYPVTIFMISQFHNEFSTMALSLLPYIYIYYIYILYIYIYYIHCIFIDCIPMYPHCITMFSTIYKQFFYRHAMAQDMERRHMLSRLQVIYTGEKVRHDELRECGGLM